MSWNLVTYDWNQIPPRKKKIGLSTGEDFDIDTEENLVRCQQEGD